MRVNSSSRPSPTDSLRLDRIAGVCAQPNRGVINKGDVARLLKHTHPSSAEFHQSAKAVHVLVRPLKGDALWLSNDATTISKMAAVLRHRLIIWIVGISKNKLRIYLVLHINKIQHRIV